MNNKTTGTVFSRIAKNLIALSALFTFFACSDGDSSSSPNQEQDFSPYATISVNEENQVITITNLLSYYFCRVDGNTAQWTPQKIDYTAEIPYTISGKNLTLFFSDGDTLKYHGNSSNSLYGTWYPDEDSTPLILTQDTIYAAQTVENTTEQKPYESIINIGYSYFMYDLYRCATSKRFCSFGQWHFEKPANSYVKDMIQSENIRVIKQTETYQKVSIDNQEYIVNVEHVQADSLNNGNAYYSAYIESNGKSCHFEYARSEVTKNNCTNENLDYLIGESATIEDEEVYFAYAYVKENNIEFAQCVYNLKK